MVGSPPVDMIFVSTFFKNQSTCAKIEKETVWSSHLPRMLLYFYE